MDAKISFRLNTDVNEKLQTIALIEQKKYSSIVREFVEQGIKKYFKKKEKENA